MSNATPRYYYNTFLPSALFFFLSDGDEVERALGLLPYTWNSIYMVHSHAMQPISANISCLMATTFVLSIQNRADLMSGRIMPLRIFEGLRI